MIYTITFNPAIDYVVHTDKINLGEINRLSQESVYFGGKGINVSLVLKELGVTSKTLGFIAGFTGKAIEEGIRTKGIETDFVTLKEGFSRINVKIRADGETDLNGQGPMIDDDAVAKLYEKTDKICDGDILVLAGSIPDAMPSDMYERIMKRVSDKRIKTVVDATGELLLRVLKYRPYLVKPNNIELAEIFETEIKTEEEVVKYAAELKKMGAVNVLVSMAEKGAVLLDENGDVHRCGVCRGELKNSVGAGDSMVAGFIAGAMRGDYEYALKLGTAAGGATAFSDGLGEEKMIMDLLGQL